MYKNYQSQFTVLLGITICFIYSLAFNIGFYGYAVDYWVIYHKPNLNWANSIFDVLGWHIATLSVFNVHIGVFVTSLLLSVSSFLLVIKSNIPKNSLFVILGFILLLHTWPILMPATNGMRQGIMMSFIFLALVSLGSNKILTLTSLLLVVFTHNSGIFFAALFLGVWIFVNFYKKNRYLLVATVVAGSLFICGSLILLDEVVEGGSRIINGDFRYPFLVINSSVAIFLLYKAPTNFLSLYVFYLNSFFPVFLFLGFNWEYERLNQIILVPTILVVASYFKYSQRAALMCFIFFLLFLLTIYTGMFSALTTERPVFY